MYASWSRSSSMLRSVPIASRCDIHVNGRYWMVALPVRRSRPCPRYNGSYDSGGEPLKPRTYVHPSSSPQNRGRLAGLEYIDSHMIPPHPPSQESWVSLSM